MKNITISNHLPWCESERVKAGNMGLTNRLVEYVRERGEFSQGTLRSSWVLGGCHPLFSVRSLPQWPESNLQRVFRVDSPLISATATRSYSWKNRVSDTLFSSIERVARACHSPLGIFHGGGDVQIGRKRGEVRRFVRHQACNFPSLPS